MTKPSPGNRFPTSLPPSRKKSIWRHLSPPPIVRLLRNLASRCKMAYRWRYTRQNRNRK